MTTKKITVAFEEAPEIVAAIDRIAHEEATSRSTIIRQMIRKALGKQAEPTKKQEQPQ